MTVDELIARARAGMQPPVLYWIGKGHVATHPADPDGPGESIDVRDELDALPPAKHSRYLALLATTGLALPPRGTQLPACDCAYYVRWALRLPTQFPNGTWMQTDAMHADALGAQQLFELDGTGDPQQASRGALLVYPRPPAGWRNARGEAEDYGHVGIVTEVDGDERGPVRRVLHCAPENWLAPPPPGTERNGIAETDASRFDEHALIAGHATLAIWCKRVL